MEDMNWPKGLFLPTRTARFTTKPLKAECTRGLNKESLSTPPDPAKVKEILRGFLLKRKDFIHNNLSTTSGDEP